MAAVLVGTGLFLYLRFESELDESLERSLRTRADEVSALAGTPGARLDRATGSPLAVEDDESFAQVIGPQGEVIDATAGIGRNRVLTSEQLAQARRGPLLVDLDSAPGNDDPVRLLARPIARGGRTLVVLVASSRDERDDALQSLRFLLPTGGLVALLLAAIAGYGLATAALRPVTSMRREAAEISRVGSGRRLPVSKAHDELRELGETLNEMLGRLERSVERERGFVASASHELRTPLALLKGELELALREGRSPEELRAALASAAEESDRLVQLAEDLLVLARSDEGRLPVRPEPLAIGDLLSTVAGRFERRAEGSHRTLSVEPPDGATVQADRLRVEQALSNLVDNALRHGDGAITLSAKESPAGTRLLVRDAGPGFDPELLGTAFERFTRGDRARSRGGTGLGLAIVDAVAQAHGGRAGVENREGGGADVWIELPQPDAPAGAPGGAPG